MSSASKPKGGAEKPKPPKAAVKRGPVARERRPSMKDVGRDPATGRTIPHVRDERLAKRVAFHVAAGMSENDIAEMLNIRPGKLKECYGHELKHGLNMANVDVAQAMFHSAKEGDTTAGKFWLKSRAGWKDGEGAQQSTSPLQIHIHE